MDRTRNVESLNKDICERCANESCDGCFDFASHRQLPWRWNQADEDRWREGYVCCRPAYSSERFPFGRGLKQCPYEVEHVVSQDAE